jgi:lipopolysaccharide transport system permease protein
MMGQALADIVQGAKLYRVWLALAREDIGDQHRRTTLGPLWLLVNYLALASAFIFVVGAGGGPTGGYATFVAVGLLVFFFLMETLIQAVTLFQREESFIKGTRLPLTVYVMRQAVQSVIRAGYAAIGCVIVMVAAGWTLPAGWPLAAVGLAIVLAATPPAITVVAFLGAYVPDSQFVIANAMRIAMFLTPVFWGYGPVEGAQAAFYQWNPFTYFVEIVRKPILEGVLPPDGVVVCLAITVGLWLAAVAMLGRLRRHLVFVL